MTFKRGDRVVHTLMGVAGTIADDAPQYGDLLVVIERIQTVNLSAEGCDRTARIHQPEECDGWGCTLNRDGRLVWWIVLDTIAECREIGRDWVCDGVVPEQEGQQ
jgi:hypothetical protein